MSGFGYVKEFSIILYFPSGFSKLLKILRIKQKYLKLGGSFKKVIILRNLTYIHTEHQDRVKMVD